MSEKSLIQQLATVMPTMGPGVKVGIGDDAAILEIEGSDHLVISTDTLNESVHFHADVDPESLGHKALAVNLSDLAAMGAKPRWALINLSLPTTDKAWVDAFGRGFGALARQHQVVVVGGDTCSGTQSVSVTVLGACAPGTCLQRAGAQPGDRVWLSGEVGSSGLALVKRQAGERLCPDLEQALDRPTPRVELGKSLLSIATACIDVSDGVLHDLGQLMEASDQGASLKLDLLPAVQSVAQLPDVQRWNLQLSGGEDYELCFTAAQRHTDTILALGKQLNLRLSMVGCVRHGAGVDCIKPDGTVFEPARQGWDHFPDPAEGSAP